VRPEATVIGGRFPAMYGSSLADQKAAIEATLLNLPV
jgi:hypothetical protein